jgi:hypothetical protein
MQVSRCLDPGMSLIVGTVNGHNVASCCRAAALDSRELASREAPTATVYVPVATSHETMQNIAATRRIAVSASHPVDHCTIQLKGTTSGVRLAREDEAAFVRARFAAFADVLDAIGIPRRITLNVTCWPAFAVDFRVEEIYDQTPGPRAGARVR